MIGGRWARCWTLRPETPYWDGRDGKPAGWLPDRDEPEASAKPQPQPKERLSKRFRLTPRRRIKRPR